MMESKPLPACLELEKSLLRSLIYQEQDLVEWMEFLSEDHFSERSFKLIFGAIKKLHEGGKGVDLLSVTQSLKDDGVIEACGGYHGVSSTVNFPMVPMTMKDHFTELDDKRKLRKILELSTELERMASIDNDPGSIIKIIETRVAGIESARKDDDLLKDGTDRILGNIQQKKDGVKVTGLQTGVHAWDSFLGGLDARFYVLASRAGRGKTSMMEQMVTRLCKDGKKVLVFEKDMSTHLFLTRIACRMSGVPFWKYDTNRCSGFELDSMTEAIKEVSRFPLTIMSPSRFDVQTFCSIVKKGVRLNGTEVVFMDHILNLHVGKEFREGLTVASSRIRDSVESNGIPHVILAQLNREAHNSTRPTPAQIKEFDALYADCDHMIMLWSEMDIKDHHEPDFPMKFLCNKNRYGAEFEEDILFNKQLMSFKTSL